MTMHTTIAALRRLRPSLAALLAACVAACASRSANVVEQLNAATGSTIVRSSRPAVFARSAPGYSRSARDYVYVGPVETDRQGVREYYLWVGVGTTLDRGFLAPGIGRPSQLFLRVHGEWMQLQLEPVAALAAELSAGHLYRTAVKTRAELIARVTLNQLELMDGDALQSIRVADASGRTSLYVRWNDAPAWPAFAAYAAGKTGGTAAPRGSRSNRQSGRRASSNEP